MTRKRVHLSVRKPHGISASSVGRALKCAWWAKDEHAWVPTGDEDELAARGTAGHAGIEALLLKRHWTPPSEAVRQAAEHAVEWLREQGIWVRAVERALFFDPMTGKARMAKVRGHRAYQYTSTTEIPATADVIGRDRAACAVVVDWKFRPPDIHSKGDGSRHEAQLLTLALALSRVWEVDQVRTYAVKLTARGAMADSWYAGPGELAEHARRLWVLMRDLPEARQVAGEHCLYCPAASALDATGSPACEANARMRRAADMAGELFSRQ